MTQADNTTIADSQTLITHRDENKDLKAENSNLRFSFRVWDNKNSEYVPEGEAGDVHCALYRDGTLECGVAYDDGYAGGIDWVKPEDAVIEKCTGLKDKNGNLIYEGDVVRFSYFDYNGKDYHMVGVIEYEMFGLMIKGVKGEHFEDFTGYKEGEGKLYLECWLREFDFDPDNDFEIIGNIHEMEGEDE